MQNKRLINHEPLPHDHPEHPDFGPREQALKRLKIALGIGLSMLVIELVGSYLSGSLSLLADAAHLTADSAALAMTLLAGWLAKSLKSKRRSYGYYRLEVLAALVNGVFLIAMAVFILIEAIDRLNHEKEINALIMLSVGGLGLLGNLLMLKVMHPSHTVNINIKGAFLHVLGDTLASVAVVVGAVCIMIFHSSWPDTAASLFVAVMISFMAVRLSWDAIQILLEGSPKNMDPDEIRTELKTKFPIIKDIHDFHIWEITSNLFAMTAHIEAEIKSLDDSRILIDSINEHIRKKYGIGHTTFQVEPDHY